MSDVEEFPVEAGTGRRTSGTVGDRLLIALALGTLLAGVVLALGNLFSNAGPIVAQESARPTTTQRPTATPHPPGEVTLVSDDPPSPQPGNRSLASEATYWLVAADALPLRLYAAIDAPVVSTMASGEVRLGIRVSDPVHAEWLHVVEPAPSGWIRFTDIRGQLLPVVADEIDKGVDMVVAGGNGFVAQLHGSLDGTTVASADGEAWGSTTGMTLPASGPWPVAWGPSGWIAAMTLDGATDAWVVESGEGSRWTSVGALRLDGRLSVDALVGSSIGYLMTLTGQDARNPQPMWFSPDGVTWHESADPWPDEGRQRIFRTERIAASDGGFVAWQRNQGTGGDLRAAFSSDGRTWRVLPVEAGTVDWFEVASLQGKLVGLSAGFDGVVAAWAGSVAGSSAGLRRDPTSDAAFAGARVTALTSDGTRAYAFGYVGGDGTARAWVADSLGWHSLPTPPGGFGAVVRAAAAGPAGLVVAGAQINIDGASPVFWHLPQGGSWVAEPSPVAARLYPPFGTDCGPLPATALAFAVRNAGFERQCFGDRSMTFDAWSGACRSCWSIGQERIGRQPAWLAEPAQFLELMPYEGYPDQGWYRAGILSPDLTWRDAWVGTWVRVTGHFDDPAARSCGNPPALGPLPNRPPGYALATWQGSALDVWRCMTRFVVTDVTVIAPP